MKRLLLFLLFLAAGLGLLRAFAGRFGGRETRQPEPEVTADAPPDEPEEAGPGIHPPGEVPIRVDNWEDLSWPATPEPVRFEDPDTGEEVFIPDFVRWYIRLRRGVPGEAREGGLQAAAAEDVELLTYREPKTLEEARALARGDTVQRDELIKWRVTATRASAEFWGQDLAMENEDGRPTGPETVIRLEEGVRIVDVEEGLTIEAESLEIQPFLDRAWSHGPIVVRHEAFELKGDGLDLTRRKTGIRVEIRKKPFTRLYGDVPGPDGQPLLDYGGREFRPGTLEADGNAVLLHEHGRESAQAVLTLALNERVHAEQEGNRTLDAESVRLRVTRPVSPATGQSREAWRVEHFEATNGVVIEYPGRTRDGEPYRLSASGRRLLIEIGAAGQATILLEGSPELSLTGAIPLDALRRIRGPGLIRASCRDQIWVGPASSGDVPEGDDPARYRRLVLTGSARVEQRATGLDPHRDTLEGNQMTALLREAGDAPRPKDARPLGAGFVVVSFALFGDVRLGGTRMSGMTERLWGDRLDTNHPRLTAEGPSTSFAFHGLRPNERLPGSDRPAPGAPASPAGTSEDEQFVLARLLARDAVVLETSLGGASLGRPARLEAEEISYDHITDRARVTGAAGKPVYLTVDASDERLHTLRMRRLVLDRKQGEIEAEGAVEGTVWLARGTGRSGGFLLPEARPGSPTTLGLATNGRIVIESNLGDTHDGIPVGAEQVLRVEGDLVAELTASNLEVDRLRARWLEAALVLEPQAPAVGPGLPTASRFGPTPTPTAGPRRPARADRWDLDAERLSARFGANGFEALEASGNVTFTGEQGRIRGAAFRFDAHRSELTVRGDGQTGTWAAFGPEEERNEVRATGFVLLLDDEGPAELRAQGVVNATLLRPLASEGGDGRGIERFDVLAQDTVVLTPKTLTTEGPVEIRRYVREAPGARWTSPFRLLTDRLDVTGHDLLSDQAAEVTRLVASGPATFLETGSGDALTRVWGYRFQLDVPTALATLEGRPGEDLRVERGPSDDPQAVSAQTRIVIDLNTGSPLDWAHPRVILRGAPR